jgi:hypothetical protein
MAEQKKAQKGKKPYKGKGPYRQERFVRKTNAVNLTVWDGYGNVLPDDDATAIINTVNEMAQAKGYLFSFVRE